MSVPDNNTKTPIPPEIADTLIQGEDTDWEATIDAQSMHNAELFKSPSPEKNIYLFRNASPPSPTCRGIGVDKIINPSESPPRDSENITIPSMATIDDKLGPADGIQQPTKYVHNPVVEYSIDGLTDLSSLEQDTACTSSSLEDKSCSNKEFHYLETTQIENGDEVAFHKQILSSTIKDLEDTNKFETNNQDTIDSSECPEKNHILTNMEIPETCVEEKTKSSTLESGELPDDSTSEAEQNISKAAARSSDLEDGEVSGDDEEVAPESIKIDDDEVPVCRFYIRSACTWGSSCRFRHPESNNKGNYVMFEKKVLPVATVPNPPAWTGYMPSSADAYQMTLSDKLVRGPTTGSAFNLNDLDIDPYYSKERPEAQERAPLLPTPTFRDLVKAQQIYPYAVEASRSVRRDPQIPSNPRPVLWERRISHSSTLNETNLSVSSPPRYAKHIRSSYRTIGSPSVSGQLVRRRNRSPSVQRSSARIRGPHTPSQSPPRRRHVSARSPPKRRRTTTRSETRRRRLSSSSSSSRDSSQSSSYQSTTETSEEALLASHHNEKKRTSRKSSSRKLRKAEYQKPEKYYSRTPAKSSSRRRNKSSPRRSSKSRERSQTRTFPKSSKKRTPVRDPPKVLPYAPKKPRTDDGENKQSRKEYLLMKLLQVEDKIARKKKQSHLK